MSLYKERDTLTFQKAMHDWYNMEIKHYESWAAKYPVNGQLIAQKDEIDKMLQWCGMAGIEYTPTFFINNRLIPSMYSINDIKLLLT
jgi:protein-disulfide isomerase